MEDGLILEVQLTLYNRTGVDTDLVEGGIRTAGQEAVQLSYL